MLTNESGFIGMPPLSRISLCCPLIKVGLVIFLWTLSNWWALGENQTSLLIKVVIVICSLWSLPPPKCYPWDHVLFSSFFQKKIHNSQIPLYSEDLLKHNGPLIMVVLKRRLWVIQFGAQESQIANILVTIIITAMTLEKADINRNHVFGTWWAFLSCSLFLFYSFSNSTWGLACKLLIMAPENPAISFSKYLILQIY